jgi:hypothetical protein
MENLLLILLLAAGAWFWWDSMNAREQAVKAAARACQQINVQFLDQTVALESIKPSRNDQGRAVLRRIYGFEYSIERVERRKGRAILCGQVLEQVQVDNDEGTTIEQY